MVPRGGEGRKGDTDDRRGAVRAVALAAMIALAGCGGFLGGGESKDWEAGGAAVPSEVASQMETPPATIYDRVEDILGTSAERPAVVVSGELAGQINPVNTTSALSVYMLGPVPEGERTYFTPLAQYDTTNNRIVVNADRLGDVEPEQLEIEIAALYVRAIHAQKGWWETQTFQPREMIVPRGTLRMAVTAYAEAYNGTYHESSVLYDEEGTTPHQWVAFVAKQHVAYEWVRGRVDSPSGIPSLYQGEVPTTSEQLLHDTDDEPRELTVEIDASVEWYGDTNYVEASYGEVGIRELLRTRLDESTADAAAAGWGNDLAQRVRSTGGDTQAMIWAQRWDSADDAEEFASAMGSYLDQRRSESDLTFVMERVGPEATVVLAGDGAAVDAINVTYTNGTVTAVVGGGSG